MRLSSKTIASVSGGGAIVESICGNSRKIELPSLPRDRRVYRKAMCGGLPLTPMDGIVYRVFCGVCSPKTAHYGMVRHIGNINEPKKKTAINHELVSDSIIALCRATLCRIVDSHWVHRWRRHLPPLHLLQCQQLFVGVATPIKFIHGTRDEYELCVPVRDGERRDDERQKVPRHHIVASLFEVLHRDLRLAGRERDNKRSEQHSGTIHKLLWK